MAAPAAARCYRLEPCPGDRDWRRQGPRSLFRRGVGHRIHFVSLALFSTALAVVGKFFGRFGWFPPVFWEAVNFVISVAVIAALLALIFRFVPDTRLRWRSIWKGASVTAVLFTLGKTAIGIYLGIAGVGSAYGAAGSLVVFIAWIYYLRRATCRSSRLLSSTCSSLCSPVNGVP